MQIYARTYVEIQHRWSMALQPSAYCAVGEAKNGLLPVWHVCLTGQEVPGCHVGPM